MDQVMFSLEIMAMGMAGIFIVMGAISLIITALNKVFGK